MHSLIPVSVFLEILCLLPLCLAWYWFSLPIQQGSFWCLVELFILYMQISMVLFVLLGLLDIFVPLPPFCKLQCFFFFDSKFQYFLPRGMLHYKSLSLQTVTYIQTSFTLVCRLTCLSFLLHNGLHRFTVSFQLYVLNFAA